MGKRILEEVVPECLAGQTSQCDISQLSESVGEVVRNRLKGAVKNCFSLQLNHPRVILLKKKIFVQIQAVSGVYCFKKQLHECGQ